MSVISVSVLAFTTTFGKPSCMRGSKRGLPKQVINYEKHESMVNDANR